MDSIVFLSVANILTIHQRVVAEFGGAGELRDRGLLEAAAAIPQATFSGNYLHANLAAMAAAYHFHLCANHAFVDGNKRVAVAAAEIFLLANDHELKVDDEALVQLTLGVAEGGITKEQVSAFFVRHVAARSTRADH